MYHTVTTEEVNHLKKNKGPSFVRTFIVGTVNTLAH